MALDTCEHFYGFVWDGEFDASEKLSNLQNLWKDCVEHIEDKNFHNSLTSKKSLKNFEKKIKRMKYLSTFD